jgi:hypothetical protein
LTETVEPVKMSYASFERIEAPREIRPAASSEVTAMFERRDSEAVMPLPPARTAKNSSAEAAVQPPADAAADAEPVTSEFLRMFPNAKPE